MNKFQRVAFFEQFPFLTTNQEALDDKPLISDPAAVDDDGFKVSRIGPELLEVRPKYFGVTGSGGGIKNDYRIYLVNGAGKVMLAVQQDVNIRHNEAHADDEYENGETVGEALLRLEEPDQVMHAVRIHTGFNIRDHYSEGGYAVTVYRPPQGFSLRGWVEEQKRRALQQIEAQVAEIDAEATR